jgi:hypothetical protein
MSTAPRQRRAAERVQGLLIMLPWLDERKRVSIHEMANTFHLSVEELSQDLTLAGLCGTPPYSPLELIEIFFDENEVWVEIPNVFNKPLRLSVAEAFALRAVADTALALPWVLPFANSTSSPQLTMLWSLKTLTTHYWLNWRTSATSMPVFRSTIFRPPPISQHRAAWCHDVCG